MKTLINFILLNIFWIALLNHSAVNAQQMKAVNKHPAILVTGASSGIGRNIAEKLAANGYHVFAGARKAKDLAALNQLENITAVRLDVTLNDDIENAVYQVEQSDFKLFGIVNNAGVALFEPLIEVSEKDLEFQMNVNVYGPYRVTKAFAPLLIKNRGRVINISSVAGITTGSMFGPYSMSKFALEAYSESLASELNQFGVAVSLVEPGNYNSKVMDNLQKREAKLQQKAEGSLFKAHYQRMTKFMQADRSRYKQPDEVSEAVIKILSSSKPDLRYMVVPSKKEAIYPIKRSIAKLVELNHHQAYRFKREQLIEWLDEALTKKTTK